MPKSKEGRPRADFDPEADSLGGNHRSSGGRVGPDGESLRVPIDAGVPYEDDRYGPDGGYGSIGAFF